MEDQNSPGGGRGGLKTRGSIMEPENKQFPILRAMGGEKLDEMGKSWEMIFELEWEHELKSSGLGLYVQGQLKGTKK